MDNAPDILIDLSVSQASLRVATEVEQQVGAAAAEMGASLEQEALCLWFCGSRAVKRYADIKVEPIMRFCRYILKEQ